MDTIRHHNGDEVAQQGRQQTVLAQPYLLLNHRALLYHDLFLDYGYSDLTVFFDDTAFRGFLCTLCLSPARLDRHPLHAELLTPFGHREPLALGPYPFTDVDAPRLTLAGTCHEFLFASLPPYLVVVGGALATPPAGTFTSGTSGGFSPWRSRVSVPCVARCNICALAICTCVPYALAGSQAYPLVPCALGVVCTVTFPVGGGLPSLHPVVVEDLPLELRGYLPIFAEGRAVLYRLLVCRHLHEPPPVVHPHDIHRDQAGLGAQETHLHADVLWVVVLVHEEVVDLADLLVVHVVDGVLRVQIFKWGGVVPAFLINQIRTSLSRNLRFRCSILPCTLICGSLPGWLAL